MSLAASHPSRITVAALVLLLVSQFAAIAAPPNPDRAAGMQREADAMVKQAEGLESRAAKAEGELADALTNAASATRQVADALKTFATAVGEGDDEDMKSAQAALSASSPPLPGRALVGGNEHIRAAQRVEFREETLEGPEHWCPITGA